MKSIFIWDHNLAVHAQPTATCNICPHHSAVVLAESLEEAHFLLMNLNSFVNDVLRGECAWVDHKGCSCQRADQLDLDFAAGLHLSPPSETLRYIDPQAPSSVLFEDTRTEVP